jgi:hypothetical protein
MKNRRVALGPNSPRGIYSRSMAAPGKSLDMPDEPVKKRVGGKIKKMADGGYIPANRPLEFMPPIEPEEYDRRQRGIREGMKGGRRFSGGGSVGSASKRADGCAVKGKTRGKFV